MGHSRTVSSAQMFPIHHQLFGTNKLSQPRCYWYLGPERSLWWGCPVYWGMLSGVHRLYPLVASSTPNSTHTPLLWQPKIPPDVAKCLLRRAVENCWHRPASRTEIFGLMGQGDLGSNPTLLLTSQLTLPKLHCFLNSLSLLYKNKSHYPSFTGLAMIRNIQNIQNI